MTRAAQVRLALAEVVRAYRIECGMTVDQVGALLSLSAGTVYAYEQARASISVPRLLELAAIYQVEPGEILRAVSSRMEASGQDPQTETARLVAARFGQDVARGASRIRNPEVQRAVLNLLAEIADRG